MSKQNKQTDINDKRLEQYQKYLDVPSISNDYKGSGKLEGKIAIITGGDSGIGRSVAVYFAREGADVSIVYLDSDDDAKETQRQVQNEGGACRLYKGDIAMEAYCRSVVIDTYKHFGRLDILVNNAGTQVEDKKIQGISTEQLTRTFEVNIFSMFYFAKAALEVMDEYSCIINTASVTAYRGNPVLLDYSTSKGAIVSFTRSLSKNLAEKNIRVNAVAPGPVWTPLVVYSFDDEHLQKFGSDTPMKRAGYPYEVAPAYVYLASADSTFVTGQVIHVNGGDIING